MRRVRFARIIQKIILAVTLLFCVFIFIETINTGQENLFTDMFSPFTRILLLLIMSATLFLFFFFTNQLLDRFSHRQLIFFSVICFAVMTGIFLLIIFNFDSTPFTDALNVQDTALYFAETGTSEFNKNAPHYSYFTDIGNNYFLILLLSFFYKILLHFGIQDVSLPSHILTATGILISAFLMFRICVRIGDLRKGTKVLVLCVLNPLYYLLILWVYTNVLSIPFMMAVIYFAICGWQTDQEGKRVVYCSLTVCSAVIGYFIRATVLIPFIAVMCCGILLLISGRKVIRKYLKSCVIAMLFGILLFIGIGALNNSYFSSVSDDNLPVAHWLMMGSHGNGTHNEADMSYTRSFDTKEEKSEAALQTTIDNYRSYNLSELLHLWGKKIIKNWCYGDGGDLMNKVAYGNENTVLYSWLLGERSDFFRLYCYSFWLTIFISIILSLIWMLISQKVSNSSFLFVLTLFGGFLFYLFWEVKASYSLPFLYIMLILAMEGLEPLNNTNIIAHECKYLKREIFTFGAISICVFCVLSFSYYKMSHTIIELKNWTIHSSDNQKSTKVISSESPMILTQEFSASKSFNMIVIGAKADENALEENAQYQIRIEDANGMELYSGAICAQDISKKNKIFIQPGEIIPDKTEEYTITIQSEEPDKDQIRFLQIGNSYLDMYQGRLIVNGEERANDLWLQVYEDYNSVWASRIISILINGGWFLIFILLFGFFCFDPTKLRKNRDCMNHQKGDQE